MDDDVDCAFVYSSFTGVLKSLDDVNSEDIDSYADVVIKSFKEKDAVVPSVFEYCVLTTKSKI